MSSRVKGAERKEPIKNASFFSCLRLTRFPKAVWLGAILVCAVCWGLNFPVSKLALAGTELDPGAFVTLRSACLEKSIIFIENMGFSTWGVCLFEKFWAHVAQRLAH